MNRPTLADDSSITNRTSVEAPQRPAVPRTPERQSADVASSAMDHPRSGIDSANESSQDGTTHTVRLSPDELGQEQWKLLLDTIECVSGAPDLDGAIETLATSIARACPGCHVRIGILETSTLRRLFDLRSGWLRSDTEFFDQNALRCARAIPSLQNTNVRCELVDGVPSIVWLLSDPENSDRCLIEIASDGVVGGNLVNTQGISGNVGWMQLSSKSLQQIIWTRRRGKISQWGARLSSLGITAKMYLSLASILFSLFALWPVSYRVRCGAVVAPQASRMIAAPFEATLRTINVQPGNAVSKGDVLVILDGRPIELELDSIAAQIHSSRKEYDIALAGGRIAEAQQARLKQRELGRRQTLLKERLQNLQVVSPVDGVVISGDLRRSIGQPLRLGQALFEIATLDQVSLELEIPEHEIENVRVKDDTRIRLNAVGGRPIRTIVEEIHPAATIRNDSNVFVARAVVDNAASQFRPGMRGEAITYGPTRPLAWSYLRSAWEQGLWWIGY